jgi:hypothetical protein
LRWRCFKQQQFAPAGSSPCRLMSAIDSKYDNYLMRFISATWHSAWDNLGAISHLYLEMHLSHFKMTNQPISDESHELDKPLVFSIVPLR